jgi:hypothetical protein
MTKTNKIVLWIFIFSTSFLILANFCNTTIPNTELLNWQKTRWVTAKQLNLKLENLELAQQRLDQIKDSKEIKDILKSNINNLHIADDIDKNLQNSKNFIAAGSYVEGERHSNITIFDTPNGHEPVPVVIKITDQGDLPSDFGLNLKNCHIIGSAMADRGEDRIIIRTERLSCPESNTWNPIHGFVFDDRGQNGIKPKISVFSTKDTSKAEKEQLFREGGMAKLAGHLAENRGFKFETLRKPTKKVYIVFSKGVVIAN